MNNEFLKMRDGSEAVHAMRRDIRFCFRAMSGILNGVTNANGDAENVTVVSKTIGDEIPHTEPPNSVMVSREPTGDTIGIKIRINGAQLNPEQDWKPVTTRFVHSNLDAVIHAVQEFCRQVGKEVEFDACMREFTDGIA